MRFRRSGDIWTAPPGGPVDGGPRRRLMAPIAFGVTVTLVLGGGLAYSSMRASTAVSGEDALAEFQAATADRAEPEHRAPSRDRSTRSRRDPRKGRAEKPAPQKKQRLVAAADGGGTDVTSSDGAVQQRRRRSGGSDARTPPQEGVYAWQVDGYEQAPGVRRELPKRSHRVITHEGPGSWEEHHIFSEEREQWMHLNLHDDGVTTSSVRNRVVMGPAEVDKTIIYNPPAFVARLPNEVGRTWQGSWSGKTSGTYTGRTFDHTTIVIQGEEIEVWASEVVMTMRGDVEGRATTRSWYSPKYSMVVKQYQNMDVESGPGNYRSEWTGQVLSVTPRS